MKKYGYHQNLSNHTLSLKYSLKGAALIMYMDDILVTSNDSEKLSKLKTYLTIEFEIKDLGSLRYFLVIEVARSKHRIFVS